MLIYPDFAHENIRGLADKIFSFYGYIIVVRIYKKL